MSRVTPSMLVSLAVSASACSAHGVPVPVTGSRGEAGSPSGAEAGTSPIQAASVPGPRFIGRFDRSNGEGMRFAWSGSAIQVWFEAPQISVTLDDNGNNFFQVVLDGRESVLAALPGRHTYLVGSGLGVGAHELSLYRRTEALFGETVFSGFDLSPAAYLPELNVPTRRLEVIGDSISAGYGNAGTYPCPFEPKTQNHYLSYAALAARALHAELHTEAWSGRGVMRNYDGTTNGTMPQLYSRVLPERSTSIWEWKAFTPDAVVVNLGTNDFAGGDPGAAFESAYLAFVTELRGHYPTARLFLALGPMLSGAQYDRALGYLNAVLSVRARAGDENLRRLEFGSQDAQVDGIGCDFHPSLKTHQKMADRLVAALSAELGW